MTMPRIAVMLSKEGGKRHLASRSVDSPYVSLCGVEMNDNRTDWHLKVKKKIVYPDCKSCAASVIFIRTPWYWMDHGSLQYSEEGGP